MKTEDIQEAITLADEWKPGDLPPKLDLPATDMVKTKPDIVKGQVLPF